jgi:hypothetical protein
MMKSLKYYSLLGVVVLALLFIHRLIVFKVFLGILPGNIIGLFVLSAPILTVLGVYFVNRYIPDYKTVPFKGLYYALLILASVLYSLFNLGVLFGGN